MRDYSKVAPTFWTGETGKKIRQLGRDAQVVALYLITAPGSNWIGLYYLPLPTLCHEVGISSESAMRTLRKLEQIDFAHYDAEREYVWIPCTAKYQIAEALKPGDKRVVKIARDLQPVMGTRFGLDFHRRYREAFLLPEICPFDSPSKPVTETKAVTEAVTEAETEAETEEKREAASRLPLPLEAEAEGPKTAKAVEAPNAKAKPGPGILFDIYDQENKQLPQVKARSQDRLAKCRSRINQAVSSGCLEQYLTDFRAAVSKAQSTPFLCGDNERGWRANFDWFVANQTNPYRVIEGKYDRVATQGGGNDGPHKAGGDRKRNPRSVLVWDPDKV